ncbi:MAG: hypothetical protein LIO86_02645 [Lachnospiraceae bacterium]|nr:hypothetical protein [Lachnospiraceae bacterium]
MPGRPCGLPDWEYSKGTTSAEAYLPELYGEGLSKRHASRLIERGEILLAWEPESSKGNL